MLRRACEALNATDIPRMADLAELGPVIVEPFHRCLPANHHVRQNSPPVDAEISSLFQDFSHFADRRFEVGITRSRFATD